MPAVQLPRLTLLLLLFALIALTVAYQVPRSAAVDLAGAQADKFLDNFNAAERGYRWSQDKSAIWLSGLGGGNLAWTVSMRLSGSRPVGTPAPKVTLRANEQTVAEFDAANEERDYTLRLAPGSLGLNGDLVLEIDSDTFTPANDPRTLGVRVIRAQAEPDAGFALPSSKVLGFALMLGLAIAWGVTKFVPAFSPRLVTTLVLAFVILVTSIMVALAPSRAEVTWWLGPLALAALGIVGLAALLARIVPRGLLGEPGWRVWIGLVVTAGIVRLALDMGRGYEGDVAIYLSLAWKTVTLGMQNTYLNMGGVPPPNTPPGLLYPFWALGWLDQQLFSPLFPPTWLNDPPILRFMLRLPALAADLIAAALVLRMTAARSAQMALTAAGFYLFNPALIFDSAYWGQTAALHTLPMLLAVIAASLMSFGWAGAALAAAVLTKPQALAIAPVVLLLAWRERGLIRLLAAGAAIGLLIDLPFIASGNLGSVLLQYVQTAQYHPYIAVNAHNLWWVATQGLGWQPDTLPLGPFSYRVWGFLLFGGAALLAMVVVWRDRSEVYRTAAFLSAAFFMLLTQIHENHILPMFAPLAIATVLDRRRWWLYGAFALTALANMTLHDPNFVMALDYPADDIYGGPALAWPRWLNAVIQTVLFAAFVWTLIRSNIKLNRKDTKNTKKDL